MSITVKYIHENGTTVEPSTTYHMMEHPPITNGIILKGRWRKIINSYYDIDNNELICYYGD